MGCGSSNATTVVQPLRPTDEDDPGSRCNRGDSAVSKLTEDSGVVVAVENGETLLGETLPGEVPVKPPGLMGRDVPMQERPTSSDILEELQNEGIIPVKPSRETAASGQAYTILLDDSDGIRRRPPARLESLRVKRLPSKEEMEEKMRLTNDRRKSREDELMARLRNKSARIQRAAAFERVQQAPERGKSAGDERRDDEESTLMEVAELLSASGELEGDSSFQRGDDKEIFGIKRTK
ncbi:stathmin domain-containing protein 1-like [Vanacampus margaritifer]